LRRRRVIAVPSAAIFVATILRWLWPRLRNEDPAGLSSDDRRCVVAPSIVVPVAVVAVAPIAITAAITVTVAWIAIASAVGAIAVVDTVVVIVALRRSVSVCRSPWICLTNVIAANPLVLIRTAIRIVPRTIVLNLAAVTTVLVIVRRVVDKPGRRADVAILPRQSAFRLNPLT